MKDQTLSCRWLFATWHQLHLTCTSPQSELLTSRSWPLLQKSLWRTWTKSLISTTTPCKRWGAFFFFCALAILHYCNLLQRLIFSHTTGRELQQASQAHWYRRSGPGWCLHPHALSVWERRGSTPQHTDLWDHVLRCAGVQLCAGCRIWAVWNIRWVSCEQGRKLNDRYSLLYKQSFCGSWSIDSHPQIKALKRSLIRPESLKLHSHSVIKCWHALQKILIQYFV